MGRSVVRVKAQTLVDLMKQGDLFKVLVNGVPQDTRVVGGSYNAIDDTILFALESGDFGPTAKNEATPFIGHPVFGKAYYDQWEYVDPDDKPGDYGI